MAVPLYLSPSLRRILPPTEPRVGGLPGKSSLCSFASNHFLQPSVSLVSETPSMSYRRAWAPVERLNLIGLSGLPGLSAILPRAQIPATTSQAPHTDAPSPTQHSSGHPPSTFMPTGSSAILGQLVVPGRPQQQPEVEGCFPLFVPRSPQGREELTQRDGSHCAPAYLCA